MTQNQEKSSLSALFAEAAAQTGAIECSGLNGSARAWLIAQLHTQVRRPLCAVAANLNEAERLAGEVDFFSGSPLGVVAHVSAL